VNYIKTKYYDTNIQIYAMKKMFPQFKSKIKSRFDIEFVGDLIVKEELPKYTVFINYRGNKSPIVKILSPTLVENAKHIYPDSKTLCLYHPENYKWKKENLIANEIMGWTAGWIYFYEVWLQTNIWYGPEAPHNLTKKQNE